MEGSTSDSCVGGEPTDGSIRLRRQLHQSPSQTVSLAQNSPSSVVFVAAGDAVGLRMPFNAKTRRVEAIVEGESWTTHDPLPPSAWAVASTFLASATPHCSTLAPLCHDVLSMIVAEYCDEPSARRLMATCRTLRYFCIAMDPVIWRPKCIAAWTGKVRFDQSFWDQPTATEIALRPTATYPMSPAAVRQRHVLDIDAVDETQLQPSLVAFSRVPAAISATLMRSVKLMPAPPPEHFARQLPTSWRAALHCSLQDAKRDFLTDDEVLELRWSVEFLRRPEPMPSTEAVFVRDGLLKRVQPAPFLPFVPWQLHDSGRKVQVDVYPAHRVRRLQDTWGWSIENAFVRFYSVLRPP